MNACINYAGTDAVTECESVETAIEQLENEYPDAVFGGWDTDGWNDDDQPMERMLVWENEETAGPDGSGDTGAHSVAEITRVRHAD